jgi:hypothetical protein
MLIIDIFVTMSLRLVDTVYRCVVRKYSIITDNYYESQPVMRRCSVCLYES